MGPDPRYRHAGEIETSCFKKFLAGFTALQKLRQRQLTSPLSLSHFRAIGATRLHSLDLGQCQLSVNEEPPLCLATRLEWFAHKKYPIHETLTCLDLGHIELHEFADPKQTESNRKLLVTDLCCVSVAKLQNLENLCLDYSELVTNKGLESLRHTDSLTELSLAACPKITPAGLLHLAELTKLRTLSVAQCEKITDVTALGALSGLQYLNLDDTPIKTVPPAACWPVLLQLSLNGCTELDEAHTEMIVGRRQTLQIISLGGCEFADETIPFLLLGSPNLTHLTLSDSFFTGASTKKITKLTKLKKLDLTGCLAIPEEDAQNIRRWATAHEVVLHYEPLTVAS